MKLENEKTLGEEGQIGETVGAVSATNSTRNTITAIASTHNVNKVFLLNPGTGKLIKKAKATICSGNAMLCNADTPAEMIAILQQVTALSGRHAQQAAFRHSTIWCYWIRLIA